MNRTQKEAEVAALQERFGRMTSAVFSEYIGLDVEAFNVVRREFRKAGVDFKVVKNTLAARAVDGRAYRQDLDKYLVNTTAVAWSYDDPMAPAKVAVGFAKDHEKFKVKCAILENRVYDADGVKALSKMPGRKELMGTLLATFNAPAQSFLRLLNAAPSNFVYLLEARRRQLAGE